MASGMFVPLRCSIFSVRGMDERKSVQMSATAASMLVGSGAYCSRRAMVSRRWVSDEPRRSAEMAGARYSLASGLSPRFSESGTRLPRMMVSRLLKSCEMPLAMRPSASILWAPISADIVALRRVTSMDSR